jgi:alkanesulfonate monooxygenase SsuD/methylene tetrahydromethanopterin reductase-like flavin-dependent oxidoreductase (luciferase family)
VTRFCVRVHHAGFSFSDLLRLARSAERLGFDGLSLYDVLNPRASEVWTTLSVLAHATRRLVLMPLVLDVGYRHPSLLAKMAASLDRLSGGRRLILGLGYGGNEADHAAYGFGWPTAVNDRVSRLEEQAQILRGLWTRSRFSFEGRWFQLSDAAGFPTATPGGPPLLIASRGQRYGLGGVARQADLCNVSFDLSPAEWLDYQSVLAEHLARNGRDASRPVELTHNATVVIRERRADAQRAFDALARSRNLTTEQARHGLEHALVGTPEDIVERLRAYAEAGVALEWVFLLFPDLPATRSMRLFAEGVLASLRVAGDRVAAGAD